MMEQAESYFVTYAPIIIVVLMFIFKNKIFVTPEQMLLMKEDLIKEIREEYATKEVVNEIKDDIRDIKQNIKEISNLLLRYGKNDLPN